MPADPLPPSDLNRAAARLTELFSEQNRQALTQLDRLAMLGTYSAGLAHEARNALVAIRTFVDLLLRDRPNAELSGVAQREFSRLESLLSQMGQLAKPAPAQMAECDVHATLRNALELSQHVANAQLLALRAELSSPRCSVWGDPQQLQQVFLNLLFNSIEATRLHGQITVATELVVTDPTAARRDVANPAEWIRVSVSDTGVGISSENIPRLFEPFFSTKSDGVGLGLAITRRIVEEHGGRISVSSVVNQGTTFCVDLPLVVTKNP